MARDPDAKALVEHFAKEGELHLSAVMLEIERAVLGCDYGGTSYTTRDEADRVAGLLGLAPGRRLLELGAGSGWPGLYLAGATGSDVALVDLPLEGLRAAAARAAADRMTGACWAVLADGAALPFRSGSFDAVTHSDVLCCLEAKLEVLAACRRVVRVDGRMVFTVISIAPGLSASDEERARESGPPFVGAEIAYPTMLRRSGWRLTDRADITADYGEITRRLLGEWEARRDRLCELLGAADLSETLARRRARIKVIEAGLLRRELFAATAVAGNA
jgi:SAM-dependent methyltransferase